MALEASEVAVRVRLVGGSAFETEAGKVAASTEAIGTAGKKANASAAVTATSLGQTGAKLNSVGSKMIGFGKTLSMVGIPLAAAGYYAAKTAATFDQQMTLLTTQAGEQAKNIGWMSKSVLAMGKQFGQTPVDIAKGLYALESVGIHGKKALDDIKAAAMGSAVGLDSLSNTTDAVSSIIASKITGSGGPLEAMSLMDRAIGLGKMHLSDLTDAFKSGIVPMASEFKMSFPQVLAMISGLTRLGTPAAQVAARGRLMFTSMEALSPGGAKALKEVGVGKFDLANALASPGGLITALKFLKSHLAPLAGPEQNAILAAVFGRSRGMGQIAGSLQALDQITGIYDTLQQTTPTTLQQHFQQTSQTSAFKYQQIRAQLDAEMITLGQKVNKDVLPVLVRLVPFLTRMLAGFSHLPKPLQDFTLGLIGLTIVGGPFFLFTGALVKGAGMFLSGIDTIVGAQGMAALRVGIASTAGELAALAAPIAAILGVYELWHAKHGPFAKARHTIKNTGYSDAVAVGAPILDLLHGLGLVHGNARAADFFAFQHNSDWFKGLNSRTQGDLGVLSRLNANAANSPLVRSIANDLYKQGLSGTDLNKVPGITSAVKQAIKEGLAEASVSVVLPNGKEIARTVNEANRKDQNRR